MAIRTHFDALVQDLRYTCRFLAKEWSFAIPVLVTLALSTGSTAAVFTLVDTLLLRALPVRSPEQLVSIGAPGRDVDLNPSTGTGSEKARPRRRVRAPREPISS